MKWTDYRVSIGMAAKKNPWGISARTMNKFPVFGIIAEIIYGSRPMEDNIPVGAFMVSKPSRASVREIRRRIKAAGGEEAFMRQTAAAP